MFFVQICSNRTVRLMEEFAILSILSILSVTIITSFQGTPLLYAVCPFKGVEDHGNKDAQRGHFRSVRYFQRLRFRGVRSMSEAARTMKDNWPGGSPSMILFQTWLSDSSTHTSLNFPCNERHSRLESHFPLLCSRWTARVALGSVFREIDSMELVASDTFRQLCHMHDQNCLRGHRQKSH